jgi:hypothetical protein
MEGAAEASLAKVGEVAQYMTNEVKRLEKEARDEQRAARQGSATPGKVSPKKISDFTEEELAAIRADRQAGKSISEVAAAHGLFQDLVRRICTTQPKER